MKKIFILLFSSIPFAGIAQQKVLTQAIITTKTTIVSPDEDQNTPPPGVNAEGGEVRMMRFGGDGETKSVTTIKGDMVKTFTETEMGRTTILRDNANKKTTTLMEMMGNKTGFYATDEEQEAARKQMDSMMRAGRQDRANNNTQQPTTPPTYDVVNTDLTKKIAGYVCKKAMIIRTRNNGNKDTTQVWYNPEFKLQGVTSTGGAGGGMFTAFMRNGGLGGLDKLDGFPMLYETQMGRGRVMTVEVTKVVTDKEIADKEFEVPKDFTLKPMKEMQNSFGPGRGFQMRINQQ